MKFNPENNEHREMVGDMMSATIKLFKTELELDVLAITLQGEHTMIIAAHNQDTIEILQRVITVAQATIDGMTGQQSGSIQ